MKRLTSAVLVLAATLVAPRASRAQSLRLTTDAERHFASNVIVGRCTLDLLLSQDGVVTAHVADDGSCAPLRLVPGTPVVGDTTLYGHRTLRFAVPLAVTNAGSTAATAPLVVQLSNPRIMRRGRVLSRPGALALRSSGNRERGGPPFLPDEQVFHLWLHGSRSDSTARALVRGDTSGSVSLIILTSVPLDGVRLTVSLFAMRRGMPVPPSPPDSLPRWLDTTARVQHSDIAPPPYLRSVLLVRFPPDMPLERRQRAIDWIGGEVVGGIRRPGSDGAYLVRPQGSGDERDLEAAMEVLRQVASPGVFIPHDVARQRDMAQPPPRPLTVLPWELTGVLEVEFLGTTTLAERQEAARAVGGRITMESTREQRRRSVVSMGERAGPDSLRRSAERLKRLWLVDQARVRDSIPGRQDDLACPPPRPDTSSTIDPDMRVWVQSTQLPAQQAIDRLIELPERDLVVFQVAFGAPVNGYQCHYRTATGVKYHDRIGWLKVAGALYTTQPTAFRMTAADSDFYGEALSRDAMVDEKARNPLHEAVTWLGAVQEYLLASPAMPPDLIEQLVRRLYVVADSGEGLIAERLMANPQVRESPRLLTMMAYLPGESRASALSRQALRAMLPSLLADSTAPAASLFNLAVKMPDPPLLDSIASHPEARRNLALLTVLARPGWEPSLLASLHDRLALPADLASDLQLWLPRPLLSAPLPPLPQLPPSVRLENRADSVHIVRMFRQNRMYPDLPGDEQRLWSNARYQFMRSIEVRTVQGRDESAIATSLRADPRVAADTQLLTVLANLGTANGGSPAYLELVRWASARLPETVLRRDEPVDDPDVLGLPGRRN